MNLETDAALTAWRNLPAVPPSKSDVIFSGAGRPGWYYLAERVHWQEGYRDAQNARDAARRVKPGKIVGKFTYEATLRDGRIVRSSGYICKADKPGARESVHRLHIERAYGVPVVNGFVIDESGLRSRDLHFIDRDFARECIARIPAFAHKSEAEVMAPTAPAKPARKPRVRKSVVSARSCRKNRNAYQRPLKPLR